MNHSQNRRQLIGKPSVHFCQLHCVRLLLFRFTPVELSFALLCAALLPSPILSSPFLLRLPHATLSQTFLSHTTLCHTELIHTQHCDTPLCHTQLCHKQLCHTWTQQKAINCLLGRFHKKRFRFRICMCSALRRKFCPSFLTTQLQV